MKSEKQKGMNMLCYYGLKWIRVYESPRILQINQIKWDFKFLHKTYKDTSCCVGLTNNWDVINDWAVYDTHSMLFYFFYFFYFFWFVGYTVHANSHIEK